MAFFIRCFLKVAVVCLLVVACAEREPAATAVSPTITIAPTATAIIPASATPTASPLPPSATPLAPTATPLPTNTPLPPTPTPLPATDETVNPNWQAETIAMGIKPAIALDSQDQPHLTYMVESEHGYVKYARPEGTGWFYQSVAEGYFYGPPAIAVDLTDSPHIVYHDHQDTNFVPEKGDAVKARLRAGEWFLATIAHPGHDGWDNSLVVDSQNIVHTASIDPSQFGSVDGVEYAVFAEPRLVEQVGSGPITYEFGTAIAVDSNDNPAITYFDDVAGVLQLAQRDPNEGWRIETVDNGIGYLSAGKFSSLAYDANDGIHITYWVEESESAGLIRYAYGNGNTWQIEDIDRVDAVEQGPLGARHLTWLALDSQGQPHVAYNDLQFLKYAVRTDTGWQLEVVAEAGSVPFGQLVVLDIDSADQPHLVYTIFTQPIIPEGVVRYAVRKHQANVR